MFIKLHEVEDFGAFDSPKINQIYVNYKTICSYKLDYDKDRTVIKLKDYYILVKETPEEITNIILEQYKGELNDKSN